MKRTSFLDQIVAAKQRVGRWPAWRRRAAVTASASLPALLAAALATGCAAPSGPRGPGCPNVENMHRASLAGRDVWVCPADAGWTRQAPPSGEPQ